MPIVARGERVDLGFVRLFSGFGETQPFADESAPTDYVAGLNRSSFLAQGLLPKAQEPGLQAICRAAVAMKCLPAF